jgi:coenzyme F420-reducing hydrogenase delta subunit
MSIRGLKTFVFYCSNNPEASRFSGLGQDSNGEIKTISLPCSGKVDIPYLIKAFESGADGVVIVTCRKDECRHVEGSLRAHKRAEAVEALLEEIGMSPGRIAVFECGQDDTETVLAKITRFMERVKKLPDAKSGKAANKQESTVA